MHPSLTDKTSQKIGPLAAALLNSTFIQGFELDDWHGEAPMHLESIVLPALFAAADHMAIVQPADKTCGADFLLAWIVGCEVGPRVGLGLYGGHMLSLG
jgi:aconitate decarboxylase